MVQVRHRPRLDVAGDVDVRGWFEQLPVALSAHDLDRLVAACALTRDAMQCDGVDTGDWSHTQDCFTAGLDIVQILADLQVDADCLLAGLLYRAVREARLTQDAVGAQFGASVAHLIDGVQRMAAIGDLPLQRDGPVLGQADGQKDNIRKMLIALVDDVRVALIKLAERTCAIRAVKEEPDRRRSVGQEVFDVYAPLAHRLGIGQLKWELEDLSFRYIYPDAYRKIARLLDGKRLDRDQYIQRVKDGLSASLQAAGIAFNIAGRAKHIYSIWRKMQRKGIGFSQVYDIRAVRILVPSVRDCYATLGLVHGQWRNIPNEFDDYIANPKENGYRSLHTAVIGPEGKVLEVQIRTEQMHEEAELGVCAHWRYKGTDASGGMASTYEEKIAWLRQVLDWHEETGDARAVAEQFSFTVAQDRVYVFTPRGDVVNLAHGATPLDFAYHVHTEIGHRCRGAKVNGSVVPLTYPLKTGERVEILLSREAQPRRDWLQANLGYLRTSRARAKVQQWFRGQARDDNIAAGRHLLTKEFRRVALTIVDYQAIARKLHFSSVEDLYAALGAGDVSSTQVMHAAQSVVGGGDRAAVRAVKAGAPRHHDQILVKGVGNLQAHMAGCCRPLPGDGVTGFITRDRGVTVHRSDCLRLQKLVVAAPERVVEVDWHAAVHEHFEADIAIDAFDRQGLLRDITSLFANARINVLTVNTHTNKKTGTATMRLRVEVPDLGALSKLLERIGRLKNVVSATRVSE